MNRETEWRSRYSLMSKRSSACSVPSKNSASDRATSVFPTPDGPRNKKTPPGRWGLPTPARARRMAFATRETASFWATMRRCRTSSILSSLRLSSSSMEPMGIPVQSATTSSMSRRVTAGGSASRSCHSRFNARRVSRSPFSSSWASEARSRSFSPKARSFLRRMSRMRRRTALNSLDTRLSRNLTRLPASSSRSTDLSGRKRSVRYRCAWRTAASTASSSYRTRWNRS